MENAKVMMKGNRMSALVVGILMCIASVILFAVGFVTTTMGLWTASIVIGAFSCLLLGIASHSLSGWTRMIGVFFLAVQIVFITIMATLRLI